MRFTRKRNVRILAALLVAGALAFASYAFTASNTVPGSSAGAGSNTISGYTVSNVQYGLNTGNPSNLDSVSFSISPAAASTVKVQLVNGGSWYSCTNSSGSVSCATTSPQVTVAAADQLTVVATS